MAEITPQPTEPLEPVSRGSLENNRQSMLDILSRMEGEEYEKTIAAIMAATPEAKRDYFDRADEEILETMAAIYPLSAEQILELTGQSHPLGLHAEEMNKIMADLAQLTGETKFSQNLVQDSNIN